MLDFQKFGEQWMFQQVIKKFLRIIKFFKSHMELEKWAPLRA